jgi:hypothetical protein
VIDIAGTLEVGETVNVTYDAVVKARDGRGDQVMVNVVYPGTVCPEDPDGECVPPDIPVEVPAGGWR